MENSTSPQPGGTAADPLENNNEMAIREAAADTRAKKDYTGDDIQTLGFPEAVRLRPAVWPLPVAEIKKCLPQYTIARKFMPLQGENRLALDRKKTEFSTLCHI